MVEPWAAAVETTASTMETTASTMEAATSAAADHLRVVNDARTGLRSSSGVRNSGEA